MSEVTTSGETTVAPVETPSAPAAAAPAFGNSRGSGLARGKRPSAPATSKETASGSYQPTAIQVVNHQREYKNPFAPEPVAEPAPIKVEQPAAQIPAEQPAPAASAPLASANPAPAEVKTPAPQPAVESKAELNILPPEEKPRPAQSWEIGNSAAQPNPSANNRREGRPDFRSERRDRQERDGRPENREQRGEFRPRERREGGDRREQFGEQRRESGEQQRREQRTFEPKPTAAQTEAKKSGFLGWLKGLFGGESTEETQGNQTQRREESQDGEARRHDGGNRGGRHHHRGGRGRGGYRGENRGENRGPQFGGNSEGQNQGGEQGQGDRRFDGNRGGGRRHHRGGRGRFRGEGRSGEHRSEGGPSSNGPAS